MADFSIPCMWVRPIEDLGDGEVKELRRLRSDNAKLRKLAEHLLRQVDLSAELDIYPTESRRCRDKVIARELGVEVDG